MQIEQIFYIIGTIYFSLWLLITIFGLIFMITLMTRMRRKLRQFERQVESFENKLAAAKLVLNVVRSQVFKKGVLLVGGGAFTAKLASGLKSLFKSDENEA